MHRRRHTFCMLLFLWKGSIILNAQTQTPKEHKFFDKHIILSVIFLILWGFFIISLPAGILTGIVCGILGIPNPSDYQGFAMLLLGCLALYIHKEWFKPELKSLLFRGFLNTLRCCPVFLLFWLLSCLPDLIQGAYPQTFNLKVLSLSLSAGISEEIIFRGLLLSYLKRQLREEKHVPLIVFVTGALFGLSHLGNILFGSTVSATLAQTVTTTCIGIFFSAVFMRGGNIGVPVLLHTLHDILMLSFAEADDVSAVITREANLMDIPVMLVCIGLGAFGFFLIRKSKRREICDMWAETWSQTTENTPAIPAET